MFEINILTMNDLARRSLYSSWHLKGNQTKPGLLLSFLAAGTFTRLWPMLSGYAQAWWVPPISPSAKGYHPPKDAAGTKVAHQDKRITAILDSCGRLAKAESEWKRNNVVVKIFLTPAVSLWRVHVLLVLGINHCNVCIWLLLDP
jgi:hypothetical protein